MTHQLFVTFIIAVNLIAYITMVVDKNRAINKKSRIPEKSLFFIAFLLGALGIYLGMKAPVNHKSNKLKFRLGVPVVIIFNVFSVWFMESKLF